MSSETAVILFQARQSYKAAMTAADAIALDVDALHPEPSNPCTEAEFDAWNEVYEDALIEQGWYAASRDARTKADVLITAAYAHACAVCKPDSRMLAAMAPAIDAALAQGREFSHMAFSRMLSLSMRLRCG